MTILNIPVVKAKGHTLPIETDEVPPALYQYALELGLKVLLNRGTSKLKQEDHATLAAFEAAALEVAEKQKASIYEGKTRMVGRGTTSKGKRSPETIEAERLAKIHAVAQMKAAGLKVSHVSAADKTLAARAYVAAEPDYWGQLARESLARAAGVESKAQINIGDLVKEDPKKTAKAKETADAKKKAAKTEAAGKTPVKAKKPTTRPTA